MRDLGLEDGVGKIRHVVDFERLIMRRVETTLGRVRGGKGMEYAVGIFWGGWREKGGGWDLEIQPSHLCISFERNAFLLLIYSHINLSPTESPPHAAARFCYLYEDSGWENPKPIFFFRLVRPHHASALVQVPSDLILLPSKVFFTSPDTCPLVTLPSARSISCKRKFGPTVPLSPNTSRYRSETFSC